MPATRILYLNGLGTGQTTRRDSWAAKYLVDHNIELIHAHVNWRSEPFTTLFDRLTELAQAHLATDTPLILVGASAGGSLAINLLGRLHHPHLSAITLSSRLRLTKLPWWDPRSLNRMAHLNTPQASPAFVHSVTYCHQTTIPNLTPTDKRHLIIARPWADEIVPQPTTTIPGVHTYKLPAISHNGSIFVGLRQLPKIIKLLNPESKSPTPNQLP